MDNSKAVTFKQFLAQLSEEIYAKKIEGAPDWSPEHAEGSYRVGSVTFSAKDGLGAVPFNQSVYYHGLVAELRPSKFLELALPHEGQRDQSAREITKLIKDGYAMGIPWLYVDIDPINERGSFARITGHEGRARCLAVKELIGDVSIPVHLFLTHGYRARDLEQKHIDRLLEAVYAEKSTTLVARPFKALYVKGKKYSL